MSAFSRLLPALQAQAAANGTASITGVAGTSAAGVITAQGSANRAVTGVSGAVQAGTLSASGPGSTTLAGVAAASASGTLSASGAASLILTGVQAASTPGVVSASGAAQGALTGAQATMLAGSLTAGSESGATASLAGVEAVASAGTLGAAGGAETLPEGVQAAPAAGVLSGTGGASAELSDASAAAQAGTLVAYSGDGIPGIAYITGVEAVASAGSVVAFVPRAAKGRFEDAEAEWNARRKWSTEIDLLLQDEAGGEPVPQGEGSPTPQAAQDAPREPRRARPAPIPSTAVPRLMEALEPYAFAQARIAAFWLAVQERDRQRATDLALALERLLLEMQRDEDDVLMLLLEAA